LDKKDNKLCVLRASVVNQIIKLNRKRHLGEIKMKQNRMTNHFIITTTTVLGLLATLLIGCGTRQAVLKSETDAQAVFAAPQEPPEYIIQAGDELDIKFFYNPELNETVTVRPDEKISLQLLDDVRAAGLTPAQLDQALTLKYAPVLKEPAVTVIVRSFTGQRVYVDGEVNSPGLVNLTAGMTALQAVINAGGLRETAKPEAAIVIRKGPENQPIPVRVDLYGKGPEASFQLQPQDIVHVPKTYIARANKFVNQYIERLILFRGTSFGFSYQLNRDIYRD